MINRHIDLDAPFPVLLDVVRKMKVEQSKMSGEVVAGADVGSVSTKCVLLKNREMVASIIIPTDADPGRAGRLALEKALDTLSIDTSQIGNLRARDTAGFPVECSTQRSLN